METIVNSAASAGAPLRTAVIIGSTREGRSGAAIAKWFVECSQQHASLEFDVIDLLDFSFPQRYPRHATPAMLDFSTRVDHADAFVVVTPEYNHGYPASLKQAIDYCCDEWFAKPAGFVAYGTSAQGLRAVEQLRQVFNALHVVTVADVVSFNRFDGSLGDDGRPRDTEAAGVQVRRMLGQLVWWAQALRVARSARTFAA
jgi:NAD(P)H-dependent FMN reductase